MSIAIRKVIHNPAWIVPPTDVRGRPSRQHDLRPSVIGHQKPDRDRNLIALLLSVRAPYKLSLHHACQRRALEIAAKLDAKVQRLLGLGYDDTAIFVEMTDDMLDFKRLLDAGQLLMDELCRRFAGFYRYAKILEQIAAGIASGEIQVPK